MSDEEIDELIHQEVKTALERQHAGFKGYLAHELSEIVIELSAPVIRADFSLRRVRRLQDKLSKL